jgi:hypothetical protein
MQITTLLRCYPAAWRDRYEAEMTSVLEEHRVTCATWLDLVRGALDARFDPTFSKGGMMAARLRRSEIIVFCSFIAYLLAGIGFQKMTEEVDKAGIMSAHAAVGIGYYAVIAGAVIAALAIAAGALPLAWSTLRQAANERRVDLLALLSLPFLLGIAIVVWGAIEASSNATSDSAGVRGLIIFVMVAAAAGAASISLAVSRADLSEPTLRLAHWPALVAGLGMALSLIGVVVWGLSLRSSSPSFFALDGGALRSYAYFTWLRVVIVMGLATLLAQVALVRLAGTPGENGAMGSAS